MMAKTTEKAQPQKLSNKAAIARFGKLNTDDFESTGTLNFDEDENADGYSMIPNLTINNKL